MEKPEENATLERLLQKLDDSPGYAGVPGIAQTLNELVEGDSDSDRISDTILCDLVLTVKLMQLANYTDRTISGRNVSTMDQALSILGPGQVRSITSQLVPVESLENKSQLDRIHAEIMAAYFCGRLAAEVTRTFGSQYSTREVQACGLLQNLGRTMAMLYLYEEIEQCHKAQAEQNITENEAVEQILGVSFGEIGAAIANHLGLSVILRNSLAPDTLEEPPSPVANAAAWYKLCPLFCRRITDILFYRSENSRKFEVAICIDFFQKALHLKEKEVLELVETCLINTEAILAKENLPCTVEKARGLLRKSTEQTTDILLQHDPLVKDGGKEIPVESIKRVMRLIHGHCGFDCTLACLPFGSGLIAVAGVGRNAAWLTTKFRSSGIKQDIFRAAKNSERDLFVPDVNAPPNDKLVPEWYRNVVGAKSFVMLPLVSGGRWLGMVYGDFPEPRTEPPPGLTEGRMLGWRNELIDVLLEESGGIVQHASEPRLLLVYLGNEYIVDARRPLLKIGRAEGADIVLQDPQASRMHATITCRDGEFVYEDISSNGSFIIVRGKQEARVRHGEFELSDDGSISTGHPHTQGTREFIRFFCQGGDEGY